MGGHQVGVELAGGEAWEEAVTRLQPVRGKDGVLRWRL